ncbi:MAG: glycosyltransferase [Legionellales bacterium]|nr:glycosyltransferase [Legionellales bacterium]
MKILHVYKHCHPETYGGIESVIYHLTQGLAKLNMTADVMTTTRMSQYHTRTLGRSRVYCYPTTLELSSCPMSWLMYRDFAKVAAQYDLIHYQYPWPFADLMCRFSKIDKPTVITYQSDIVRQRLLKPVYLPLAHWFLNRADAITTTSENLQNSSDTLHRYRDKTSIIPIGIDSDCYPTPSAATLAQWQTRVGQQFFLFLGVLRYYKGVDFLLKAVRDSDIPVVIAGAGPEQQRLQQLAHADGLSNVQFVGQVSDEAKMALLTLCRCVVAPAHLRTEAFCISLVEGLLFGKPLISTDVGTGTSFVNQQGRTGLVIPPADPNALRQAMQQLMDDQRLYTQLQAGAKAHYQRHFTSTVMAQQYVRLYQTLLAKRGRDLATEFN